MDNLLSRCLKLHVSFAHGLVDIIVSQLELFPKETVIQRLTGDGGRESLIGPLWSLKKFVVLNEIDKEMIRRKSFVLCILFFTSIISVFASNNYRVDWADGKVYSSAVFTLGRDYNYPAQHLLLQEEAKNQAEINFYRVFKSNEQINTYSCFSSSASFIH